MTYRREWDGFEEGRGGFGGGHQFSLRGRSITVTLVIICAVMQFATAIDATTVQAWLGLSASNAYLVYPFFSYAFLHSAGGLWHLIFNCLILLFLGRDLEAHLGTRRFLTLYFGAAALGGLIYTVGELIGGTHRPVVGASGAIMGMIAYVAWWTPNRQFILYFVPVRARVLFWIFVAVDLYSQIRGGYSTTAHLCHLGGGLGGYLFWRFHFDPLASWQQWFAAREQRKAQREVENEADEREEMDRILRKINAEGISSLTSAERAFADRRGKKLRERQGRR